MLGRGGNDHPVVREEEMKLHEYQIEDARAMMNEFAGLDGQCYDENSRALIKRFVEIVEGWVLDDIQGMSGMKIMTAEEVKRIFPYGDQPSEFLGMPEEAYKVDRP